MHCALEVRAELNLRYQLLQVHSGKFIPESAIGFVFFLRRLNSGPKLQHFCQQSLFSQSCCVKAAIISHHLPSNTEFCWSW